MYTNGQLKIVTKISDCVYMSRLNKTLITFSGPPTELNTTHLPFVGQRISITNQLNDTYVVTVILGIQRYARNTIYPNDPIGILVDIPKDFPMLNSICHFIY